MSINKERYHSLLREREDWVRKIERSQDPVWRHHCQSEVQEIDVKLARLRPIIEAEERRRAAELARLKPIIEAKERQRAAELAEKLAREKKEAEEIAEKEAEFFRRYGRHPYKNHCYRCMKNVNEAIHSKCDKCEWLICVCGSCKCNMQFAQ